MLADAQIDRRPAGVSSGRLEPVAAFDRLRALELAGADGREILLHAIRTILPGRVAAVSSFGAESAVLLSLIAEIDPTVPVIFLQTGKHFAETLAYRDELVAHLGLRDARAVAPQPQALADRDPTGELWYYDSDACCGLRKVQPLGRALAPFDAWISGRKRFQSATRSSLPFVELVGERVKLNPIADWDGARVRAELQRRRLPAHPLVQRGYASIGCAVCTRAVGAGEDARAGRWAGQAKVECGIHGSPGSP
ncbi:phosphoadenylyl-sulfate reductase [Lichenicola sp.]|uniref:phosphoadenylyl-sulfate reductase n=1 Tax=Lichenicola sp. TaxID=2804529 RepID=UPI003B005EA0